MIYGILDNIYNHLNGPKLLNTREVPTVYLLYTAFQLKVH